MEIHEKAINRLIEEGFDFDMSHYMERGFKIFSAKMSLFVLFTALFFIINILTYYLSVGLGMVIVRSAFLAGYFIVANSVLRNEEVTFERFFDGFKMFFPLFVSSLIIWVFSTIGFFLLVFPFIYVSVAYSFTTPFIVFFKMDFWTAMETSRKLITRQFWPFFGFFLVLAIINVFGAILLGIGALFTFPATLCMVYAAFEDILGTAIREEQERENHTNDSMFSGNDSTYTY